MTVDELIATEDYVLIAEADIFDPQTYNVSCVECDSYGAADEMGCGDLESGYLCWYCMKREENYSRGWGL